MKLASKLKAALGAAAFIVALLFLGYQVLNWYWRSFAIVNAMRTLTAC